MGGAMAGFGFGQQYLKPMMGGNNNMPSVYGGYGSSGPYTGYGYGGPSGNSPYLYGDGYLGGD